MDLRAEVDRALEEMEWGDVVTTLTTTVHELLNDKSDPPSPSPPPPPLAPVSAGLEANAQPQPAESQDGGYGDCIPVGADHHMFEEQNPFVAAPTIFDGPLHREDIMQPGQMHGDAGACCQGQYLPNLWPVEDVPTTAGVSHPAAAATAPQPAVAFSHPAAAAAPPQPAVAFSYPAAPPQTAAAAFSYPAAPPQPAAAAFSYPAAPPQPAAAFSYPAAAPPQTAAAAFSYPAAPPQPAAAAFSYPAAAPPQTAAAFSYPAAPPQNTSNSKKRKRDSQQDDERPYVKKPPNAFMLFLKEQRANVQAEVGWRGSVSVNTVLGERWRSLTKEQQAKYYNQAEKERLLHSQQHPEWSTKDNYGKKKKRQRGMASRLDSLKTLSTSLTSPLAPAETQSPPTERMLEERCHPTTVRPCTPPVQPQLPSSGCKDTFTSSLTSPLAPTETQSPPTKRTLEERCHPTTVRPCTPPVQPQLLSSPRKDTFTSSLTSPLAPTETQSPPTESMLEETCHPWTVRPCTPPVQPQLPSSRRNDTFTSDVIQMIENCFCF